MEGDGSLIVRMLDNLIQNSIAHNPGGCRIVVAVRSMENGCEYSVTDNGTGLSAQQLEQFNAAAFPEPSHTASGEVAHGLGLRLVQQIVAAHGASIAYTTSPAVGLCVTVVFAV